MAIEWEEDWTEVLTLFFMILGFIISVLLQNAVLSYLSIILAGLLAGRIYYIKRFKAPILPFILMIVGFLLGYLISSFRISRIATLILFSLGFGVSYYLHLKKILVIFKSKDFIK